MNSPPRVPGRTLRLVERVLSWVFAMPCVACTVWLWTWVAVMLLLPVPSFEFGAMLAVSVDFTVTLILLVKVGSEAHTRSVS